ncbi:unnamed protein product [Cuscuta epithymum]|uniref:Uncharacterized protein n=1 Tax=Cuscuta epithymum TaxID=186058 RepID=A0AAV0DN28_9ASTE|nr:unnamed protein product [Cuscuta epithymum]
MDRHWSQSNAHRQNCLHLGVHLLPCACSHLLLSTRRPLPPLLDAAVAGGVLTAAVETVVDASLPKMAAEPLPPVQSTKRSSKIMTPTAILEDIAAFSPAMLWRRCATELKCSVFCGYNVQHLFIERSMGFDSEFTNF